MHRPSALLLALLCAITSGCARRGEEPGPGDPGPGPGPGPGMPGETLVITPGDAILDVDGKSSATLAYRVQRAGEDVTQRAALFVDNGSLGSFAGGTFTARPGAAGKTTVRAQLDGDKGSASLTLRVRAVVIAKGAPPDAPDKFGGPDDPGRAPELVYPPDGVLVPPNINELELQWRKRNATLFEISLLGDGLDLRIYTPCAPVGDGCALVPDEPTWQLMTQVTRGKSVKWTVRGSAPEGGGVGSSASFKLSFSEDDMKGGLYYWGASRGGIFRYDFGRRSQKAEAYYTPGAQAGLVTCVGCHALSRNGKRMAVGMNIPGPAQMRALDVATRGKLFEVGNGIPLAGGSDFQAFTPDGSRLITVEKGGLTLRNADNGNLLGASPLVPNANMPDFAPDGKTVVFARGACPIIICPTLQVENAELYTVPFNADSFGMPTVLVAKAAGQNNYYPSFSPDGRFVVFNRSSSTSYDAADARVMVVPAAGGQPIDLGVNAQAGNSWPKWSPFQHRFQGAPIMWLTFSSRRSYGLRQNTTAQIWMVPVDSAKLQKGEDPGFPAFWLPFQDLATGNHIPQWVEKVERQPCTGGVEGSGCAGSEMCVDGFCVPGIG